RVTDSMRAAMDETARRRSLQAAYNAERGITPKTVLKAVENPLDALFGDKSGEKAGRAAGKGKKAAGRGGRGAEARTPEPSSPADIAKLIGELEKEMRAAARELEFERAAELRDRIRALRERLYVSGEGDAASQG
ncbi:MAG: UvrB/UvrC motif-containing protein, partial [Mailhella sp.]|nr:UvrB/UvrC motif-containing protein [Mailhella sp.]